MAALKRDISRYIYGVTALIFVVVAVVFIILAMTGSRVDAATTSGNDHVTDIIYTSYEIEAGDSLWSIAGRYKYAGTGVQDFVEILKEINGITADDIHAGRYLLIPVYIYV